MLLISVSRWVTGAEGISWDAIPSKIKIYQAQKLTKLEYFEDNGYLWVSTVENLWFFFISRCHNRKENNALLDILYQSGLILPSYTEKLVLIL